ncbi:hypothetical protein [Parasitella parasitica]|uniref:SH3 domain-containing protein n=1 Tax=Parasitella parasitica TaxID=35722 RepID=A0A0B7NDG6_9FUNG|nr:hypothetical protein [Parasitella parasitica]
MVLDKSATKIPHFKDNFWESLEKNGITILIERMRGAKQTCERYKHAYEARILLEEEYSKTLLQIAQKQKPSSVENGSSKSAMDTMQREFLSVGESHLQLSKLLREKVASPLTDLISKQKSLRKEAQASIQRLYTSRQLQVDAVRKAHKRHNLEIEKANLLVQQETTDAEKRATFKKAEINIGNLKKVYDEALANLEKIVQDWNVQWKRTCESFEQLEAERLEFFKSNLSNCANLMIGCLESEVQACERVNTEANRVNVEQDLTEFVKTNKSSDIIPLPMEYIKLQAYHEANHDRSDSRHSHNMLRDNMDAEGHSESEDRAQHRRRRSSVSSMASEATSSISKSSLLLRAAAVAAATTPVADDAKANLKETAKPSPANESPSKEPVLVMGVMEVYRSDEEEYEDETESESEGEEEVEVIEVKEDPSKVNSETLVVDQLEVAEAVRKPTKAETIHTNSKQDEKVDRLKSAYQDIKSDRQTPPPSFPLKQSFNRPRRVSFAEDNKPINNGINGIRSNAIPTYTKSPIVQDPQLQHHQPEAEGDDEDYEITSESAALELDDMLRELDSKRIAREESPRNNRYPDIQPTPSISSPSLMQQQQKQRKSISSQYFQKPSYPSFRRMSSVEASDPLYGQSTGSVRSTSSNSYVNPYDPFNSLSSNNTHTISTQGSSRRKSVSKTTSPSVQSLHDRMLQDTPMGRHGSISSASSFGGSVRSHSQKPYQNDNFIQNYYSVGRNTSREKEDAEVQFIDFACAIYDYEAADEGEIGFKEGDLLGIISKNKDDEHDWWEASLLRNQKIVRTGLVPSNFLGQLPTHTTS